MKPSSVKGFSPRVLVIGDTYRLLAKGKQPDAYTTIGLLGPPGSEPWSHAERYFRPAT